MLKLRCWWIGICLRKNCIPISYEHVHPTGNYMCSECLVYILMKFEEVERS